MTKAELIAAIADAPDDAEVYRDNGYGEFLSAIEVTVVRASVTPSKVLIVFDFADEETEEAAA